MSSRFSIFWICLRSSLALEIESSWRAEVIDDGFTIAARLTLESAFRIYMFDGRPGGLIWNASLMEGLPSIFALWSRLWPVVRSSVFKVYGRLESSEEFSSIAYWAESIIDWCTYVVESGCSCVLPTEPSCWMPAAKSSISASLILISLPICWRPDDLS